MATAAEERQRERIVELLAEGLVAQSELIDSPYVDVDGAPDDVVLDGHFNIEVLADFIADGLAL